MRRTITAAAVLVALVAAALPASPLAAQADPTAPPRSRTDGLALGAHLNGSAVSPTNEKTQSGGGAGVTIGYGFSPSFMISAQLDLALVTVSEDDEYALAHFDLGARYSFADPRRAWVPHLDLALTGRAGSQTVTDGRSSVDVTLSGSALSFGGGVQYFVTPRLAIDGTLLWSHGRWDRATVGGESIDGSDSDRFMSSRFNLGLRLYR
jgi:opacity protein-like surface antigen